MPAAATFGIIWAVYDGLAAFDAGGSEIVQPLEISAFALPVPNGVFNKLQGGSPAEIIDWEDRIENSLDSYVLSFRKFLVFN